MEKVSKNKTRMLVFGILTIIVAAGILLQALLFTGVTSVVLRQPKGH